MSKMPPIGSPVPVPALLGPAVIALGLVAGCGTASAASAVQKECAAKYQAAKAANGLNGQTYRQYYKQCAAETKAETPAATPVQAAAPAPAAPAPAAAATTTAPVAPAAPTRRAAPSAAPAAPGNAVFPTAVSAQFSKETAGKARLHTCLAQYKANKADNGNGGLKWIQAGGGYYSACNNRLKG